MDLVDELNSCMKQLGAASLNPKAAGDAWGILMGPGHWSQLEFRRTLVRLLKAVGSAYVHELVHGQTKRSQRLNEICVSVAAMINHLDHSQG